MSVNRIVTPTRANYGRIVARTGSFWDLPGTPNARPSFGGRHNPTLPQHRGACSGGPLTTGAAKSPKNGGAELDAVKDRRPWPCGGYGH